MSGVCGVLRFDGAPVPPTYLDPALQAMSALGSEARVWAPETPDSPASLGCRPLRVTAEDVGYDPPLQSPDGRLVLVADARIDNRAELADRLGFDSPTARALPDAGFILAAYRSWGPDCPRHLIGDFAFLIWDADRRSLLCARDGIGNRVLYQHLTSTRLVVATTPGALLALADVPARLNEQRVAESLVLIQDPVNTFYQGVERVPPGHTLTATARGVTLERFWSPEPTRGLVLGSDEAYVEAFLAVFDEAVRSQSRSAGPVGVMLSGGLDSPSVAATAAMQLSRQGTRLHAFHAAPRLGFSGAVRPGWVADESPDVQAVAEAHPNMDLEIYRPTGGNPLLGLDAVFEHAGLPPRNPGGLDWFDAIYGLAQEKGVRVLLAGHKGNATISYGGVRSLRDIARQGRWGHVLHEIRAVARATDQRVWNVFREQILMPLLPTPIARAYFRLRTPRATPIWAGSFSAIHPEFARQKKVDELARQRGGSGFQAGRIGEREYRALALTIAADAPDLYNAARTRFGIETRSPACDLRVVEYCFSIPGSQYLRDGTNRWLIRRAMRGRLPDRVVTRTTRGSQGADWTEWMSELRQDFGTEIRRLGGSATASRCLDLPRLRSLVDGWPERLGPEHESEYHQLLLRGVTMGRFIRWFEGRYG